MPSQSYAPPIQARAPRQAALPGTQVGPFSGASTHLQHQLRSSPMPHCGTAQYLCENSMTTHRRTHIQRSQRISTRVSPPQVLTRQG